MTGLGLLTRFILRRDRVVLPICVAIAAGFVLITASSFQDLYPTAADRAHFAATIEGNGTYTAIYGPARALDTIGGLTAWRTGSTLAVIIALMNMLLVGRHTRAEEERGRTELVRAGAVGARAPLAAALTVVIGMDVLIAVIVALGLIAMGLPAAGSIALGASLAAGGIVFAGVGAVAGQLTEGVRAANGLAGAALGAAFLLRAAGDSGTARSRGCHRSAGRTPPARSPTSAGGRCCSASPPRPRSSAARSGCSPAATSAPGCCRRAPGRPPVI